MEHLHLERIILGNSISDWLIVIVAALFTVPALRGVKALVRRHYGAGGADAASPVNDLVGGILSRTRYTLLTILAFTATTLLLSLPQRIADWITSIAAIALLIQLAIWADGILDFAIRHRRGADPAEATTLGVLRFTGRVILFSITLLLVLDNIPGVQVTTLIASLGIGGIAVALAVQNILSDLFASLSIALDKPFVIGDFIIVGEQMGTVEKTGLKTTRVRSLSGEQLVFSNTDLLSSRIRNFKRMSERRVLFGFGVIYGTPADKLRAIPGMVREIVEARQGVRFDRAHFKAFGESSLDFEIVYYMLTPDYNAYMDTQQAINLALFERFTREGIDFAFPTRTLHAGEGWESRPARAVDPKSDLRPGGDTEPRGSA
ncbi:MAG: mechanosensitive ion channel family protein [Candidatus Eisenbacteria bacterium]|nr:mechanosensitive ion channel family protein [Candidatus Eisenbacteria bacterium]